LADRSRSAHGIEHYPAEDVDDGPVPPTTRCVSIEVSRPSAADVPVEPPASVRSLVLCATPGAGEDVVGQAFEACGAGTPRPWFDVRRVAPGLLARWELTDLDDYVAALHERRTTDTGIFGLVLHWHDLRRIQRQVAGLRQPTAQRMLDIVEVLAPQPVFVRLLRADSAAHVEALRALEQPDHAAPHLSGAERSRLRARIDATETVWTQWFDALGVKPAELVYEEAVADPARVRDLAAGITGTTRAAPESAPDTGTRA
jgi:LPS sulfotransferase NodH